ncbi:MAG: DEAD/DEAH box helicase family protein, partial [Candidatus Auribacterota bacterium]|nr:DEAD/DEAH box helicase family protein [Candidatus Auribacterota bacterium]
RSLDNERIEVIERRIFDLEQEKKDLLSELKEIRRHDLSSLPPLLGFPPVKKPPVSPDEKIQLFLTLFRCREDVYPKLWVNAAKGKSGYSPMCQNEWKSGLCFKPQTKCSKCPNRAFLALDAQAARMHLEGKISIGTYAIRKDDTCTFLAADFDKMSWSDDVIAYKNAARELGIDVAVERSRSGNGAHAWIFFSQPVPARLARQLGTVIMSRASSNRYTLTLDSHDRFFPSQDFLPKGGFGNLIALPLQKVAREQGNTVFVNDEIIPYPDQWGFLARQKRLSLDDIMSVLDKAISRDVSDPSFPFQNADIQIAEKAIDYVVTGFKSDFFPHQIQMRLGAQLEINIDRLPSKLISAFKRTATFANPEFFRQQRMRFSTWNTPRYIFCGELRSNHLVLPRGSLNDCLKLSKAAGAEVNLADTRMVLPKIKMKFRGRLSREQKRAAEELIKHENGVLVAPPGIGKTVIACSLIGKRKARTLILVHRKQLLDQWINRLTEFLTVKPEKIGVLSGNTRKMTGVIDIVMLQTLTRMKNAEDSLSNYEQVIIDECQHIPPFSFESVIKIIPARYFLGLTATPYRKDGHQPIIFMQCGPIRHEMMDVTGVRLEKRVIVRETSFSMPSETGPQPQIHEVWEKMSSDPIRLNLIACDVIQILQSGRFPLILSERKNHLRLLSESIREKLNDFSTREFLLTGDMGKKARKKSFAEIQKILETNVKPYILATGSLIGEGFDLPQLDTLVLGMPIAFKGRVVQYAGRLHRKAAGKSNVLIYDYLDKASGLTISMFRKRVSAYKKMGYHIDMNSEVETDQGIKQGELFGDRE